MGESSFFWKDRRVLITGGAGFIGYALAKNLNKKRAKVSVLDIKKKLPLYASSEEVRDINYIRGTVTSKKTVREIIQYKKIQTIFHLAAEALVGRAFKNPVTALETNVKGTWVILESARTSPGVEEIVIASSDKAYGTSMNLPYREDTPLAGENPYDVSKSSADLIAHMYAKTYQLPIVIARCGNVYGPGDLNWSRLIPDAFKSLATGKDLLIRSDGEYSRDYVYVDDIVDAYSMLAAQVRHKRLSGEAFNFGTNRPLSVQDVLHEIAQATKAMVPHTIMNTARHEIRAQYLDSRKARRVLKWNSRVARSDGFKKTADWYAGFLRRK